MVLSNVFWIKFLIRDDFFAVWWWFQTTPPLFFFSFIPYFANPLCLMEPTFCLVRLEILLDIMLFISRASSKDICSPLVAYSSFGVLMLRVLLNSLYLKCQHLTGWFLTAGSVQCFWRCKWRSCSYCRWWVEATTWTNREFWKCCIGIFLFFSFFWVGGGSHFLFASLSLIFTYKKLLG